MLRKDDKDSEGEPMPTDGMYTMEDIFRRGFKVEDPVRYGYVVDKLIGRLCDNCDYVKDILCMVVAVEMLKQKGFEIHVMERSCSDRLNDAYFSRNDDRVVLFVNENIDNLYMALMDQLIYKVLTTIKLNNGERKDIMNVLDVIKETERSFHEELTQREIKMLEWLDIKLVDLIDKLSYNDYEYFTHLKHIDENVINLVGVCLMWGRNFERLDVVSRILNPLTEYIQDTILTKIERFIITSQVFDKILIPDYFKVKLNTIKLLNEEYVPDIKKFSVLRDIRELDVPVQTDKSLDELKLYINKLSNVDNIIEEFDREKSIYMYSMLQRNNEISYIENIEKKLKKNEEANKETLAQLSNLKNIIESEGRDLEESLKIIYEKINILKGTEV